MEFTISGASVSYNMPLKKKQRSLLAENRVAFLFFSCNIVAILQLLICFGRDLNSIEEPIPFPPIPFPPNVDICNVTQLFFDESKMTADAKSISRAHIPVNRTTNYAYGPFIAKSGSTSMMKSLQYAANDLRSRSIESMSEESLDQYQFLSVLRHPMERALAGFHQVEVFWNRNWINEPIRERQLTWWNKTCLNSTWTLKLTGSIDNPCRGTDPKTTTERRLRRLNDFLDEIGEKGYWDQHVMPITYLIASNRVSQRAKYFDIKYVNTLTTIISQAAGKDRFFEFLYMQRGGMHNGMDWVFRWKELVTLATKFELAQSAIEKLCHLYQNDVSCLPYDVPECQVKK